MSEDLVRYHLSPLVGPARCYAKNKCEFADAEGNEPEHYSTRREAEEAWERKLAAENSIISTLKQPMTTPVKELRENDLIDIQEILEEMGAEEEVIQLSIHEYTRVDFIEETSNGGVILHTTTQGSLSLPADTKIITIDEPEEEIEEFEENEQDDNDNYDDNEYSKEEIQELFEDAVMDFGSAREKYALYLATLPDKERRKASEKYREAILKEDNWIDYY